MIAKRPAQRVFGSRSLSEVLATVLVMAERQLGEVGDADSLVSVGGVAVFPDLPVEVAARIEQSIAASRSAGTRRAYASAWSRFENWCIVLGHQALPAHPATEIGRAHV